MKIKSLLLPTLALTLGGLIGYGFASTQRDRAQQETRLRNYADRAIICTEALARLRIGETESAISYLEDHVNRALHGVPNWQGFRHIAPQGQWALAQAKVYRSTYPTQDKAVNWYLRDVPPLATEKMSESLRKLALAEQPED